MENDGYKDEIFTKRVRAGKRTYFFDVKSTKSEKDYYITITESKRVGDDEYEKHKIFLYKEDFEKFLEGYKDAVAEIERLKSGGDFVQREEPRREEPHGSEPGPSEGGSRYTDVNFDDLDKK